MMRLTTRNYFGQPYVPGYAPRCNDVPTCELIVKMTRRLALLEDIMQKYGGTLCSQMSVEDYNEMKKEGII